jgi:hypothetical protein
LAHAVGVRHALVLEPAGSDRGAVGVEIVEDDVRRVVGSNRGAQSHHRSGSRAPRLQRKVARGYAPSAAHQRRRERRTPAQPHKGTTMGNFPTFEELDTDGDGKVSYEEMKLFHTTQPMPKIPPEWLADENGDQTITKEEYEAFKSSYEFET